MPFTDPEPGSPEALEAARKVRVAFMILVIINIIAFVVIAMNRKDPPPTDPNAAPAPAQTQ